MLETLFENIGGKIKKLAVGTFVVEAIAAIIGGIGLMVGYQGHPYAILGGLATIFFGLFVALVSSWLLYGFGQLIENSDIVAKNTQAPATRPVARQTTTPPVARQTATPPAAQATAPQVAPMTGENAQKPPVKPESREHGDIACPSCGQVQNENRRVCYKCGQRFKAAEGTTEILVEAELHEGDYVDITCPKCGEALCFLADTENAVCSVCDTKIKLS